MDKNAKGELDRLLDGLEYVDLDADHDFVKETQKGKLVDELLDIMKEEGLSQAELARRMGKKKQYVSRILNETANITLDTLVEITIALGRKLSIKFVK